MLSGFFCDNCGFASSEEIGHTYYCPKCGNKMKPSKQGDMLGNGGDPETNKTVMAWDLMYLIFVGGLTFGIMNYITYWTNDVMDWILFIIWALLFIFSFVRFHKWASGSVSNKAIKK